MHDEVKEGDLLQTSAPRNSFLLNENADYSLLMAGGIGVTPILSMVQRLAQLGKPFEMHYSAITGILEGVPDHRDEIFSDEEHTSNDQMTPCCLRSKSKLLVLDL